MATVTGFHGQGLHKIDSATLLFTHGHPVTKATRSDAFSYLVGGSIANQLLEDGKAAYGVPGPGAYLVPSSFRHVIHAICMMCSIPSSRIDGPCWSMTHLCCHYGASMCMMITSAFSQCSSNNASLDTCNFQMLLQILCLSGNSS